MSLSYDETVSAVHVRLTQRRIIAARRRHDEEHDRATYEFLHCPEGACPVMSEEERKLEIRL